MADIAASDVTYTEEAGSAAYTANQRRSSVFSVVFGNGALTYPSGGVPLTKAKLGCPTQIDDLIIEDAGNANGFLPKWDRTNNKIRMYQVPATPASATGLVEFVAGTTAMAAVTLKVRATGY